MQANIKRFLSMLMVFVLILGLIPSAAAATDDGTKDWAEPTGVEESTQSTEPEDSTEPIEPTEEEWDPLAPTPEDLERWAELASQLPDTIREEFPYAEGVEYPYGEPQENYYPGILLDDPWGISLLTDMSQIPEDMFDNAILRALEYMGYDDYSPFLNGDETVTDSSTVAVLLHHQPDLLYF